MLTPDDLDQIRAIVRAELASAAQGGPPSAPCGADADRAGLRTLLARKRLVTGREAAAALLGCQVGDVGAGDVKYGATTLRELGWNRYKLTRDGVRGWYYRRAKG